MAISNAINKEFPFTPDIGGTGLVSPTANGVLITNGAFPFTSVTMLDGEVLIGQTGGAPLANQFTAGPGMEITYGPGSITFANNGASVWVDQTTASATLINNRGYVCNAGASLITFTLPTTALKGDWIEINGFASGLFTIAQNAGQSIVFGNLTTTTGVAGSITSTLPSDGIKIRCVDDDLTWTLVSSVGNLNVI